MNIDALQFCRKHAAGIAFLALALSCGSSNDANGAENGAGGAQAFVGTWSCNLVLGGSTPVTITIVANNESSLTASLTGSALTCSLKLTPNGSTATVDSGQSCTQSGATLQVTSGSATVNGSKLSGSLVVSLLGTGTSASYACTKN